MKKTVFSIICLLFCGFLASGLVAAWPADAFAQSWAEYQESFDPNSLRPNTTKDNVYRLIDGPFGTLCLIASAFMGFCALIASAGKGVAAGKIRMLGVSFLLGALVLFSVKLMVSSGVIQFMELRDAARSGDYEDVGL